MKSDIVEEALDFEAYGRISVRYILRMSRLPGVIRKTLYLAIWISRSLMVERIRFSYLLNIISHALAKCTSGGQVLFIKPLYLDLLTSLSVLSIQYSCINVKLLTCSHPSL